MQLFFKKLVHEGGEDISIEFAADTIFNIQPIHFVLLKRPILDEGKIAFTVRREYAEKIATGLFNEVLEKKMEREIQEAIATRESDILLLPPPTIFIGNVWQVKYSVGSIIKLGITKDTALYFVQYADKIKDMVFELKDFPTYISGKMQAEKVLECKDEFIAENPYAIEHEDNYKKFIEELTDYTTKKCSYEKPQVEYKDKVVRRKEGQDNNSSFNVTL